MSRSPSEAWVLIVLLAGCAAPDGAGTTDAAPPSFDTAGPTDAPPASSADTALPAAADAGREVGTPERDGPENGPVLADASANTDTRAGGWWRPAPGTSWQWQLSGKLDTTFGVSVYDIDLFETTPAQIASLHAQKRFVVCYFDTAYEPGRPDSAALLPYRGSPVAGWPGQYWLDIRQPPVVEAMKNRLALAAQKSCDGVEADDVDARSNSPGFPLSAADQQGFIRTLAGLAHDHGLGFGLKNDLDEVPALLAAVDFAINESCFQYNECDALKPFIAAGKAVFHVEYTDGDLAAKGATICPQANTRNFDSLIKHLDLGAPRFACR